MSNTISITRQKVARFEEIEAKAWGDLFLAADNEITTAYGIKHIDLGTGCATMASKFDTLAFNRAVGLGLSRPADASMIDNLIREYRTACVPRFFVQLSPSASPDYLPEILTEQGFSHYNNWIKLYRGIEAPHIAKSDLHVEEISVNLASEFGKVLTTSFDWSPNLIPWISCLVGRPGWRHYLAFNRKKPVATGALYVHGEFAWLDFASTLPEYRGRGAQSILVERRIRDAADSGCKTLVVETAEETPEHAAPSYQNMLRLGFQVAYVRPNYLFNQKQ